MKNSPDLAEVSFRDPGGCVCFIGGRVIRIVNRTGQQDLQAFLATGTSKKLLNDRHLVASTFLQTQEVDHLCQDEKFKRLLKNCENAIVIEHERVFFPSFPYEWAPEMLFAAGRLTLDIATELLQDTLGLKDATPYNILFRGPEPVFIDLLSFERRDPGDYVWLPYAQFIRTFMLPLLANKKFHLPLADIFITRRDGLEPEEIYHLCSALQRFKSPFLSLVSIPKWLAGGHNQDDQRIYQKKLMADPEKAKYILESLLNGLRRGLKKLAPAGQQKSEWSDYMESNNNYNQKQLETKCTFVNQVLGEYHPKKVLDIGCNTGFFSVAAAKAGASVVAIDYDPVVVGKVWRNARESKLDILPLVVNLTRPTPAIGWVNQECQSFLERAQGTFDMVFMLAVVHHMMVSERVPLAEIIAMAARITTKFVIVEYVDPADSMFRRLSRGRDHLFGYLNKDYFEAVCNEHFKIVRSQPIDGGNRCLYLLVKKGASIDA